MSLYNGWPDKMCLSQEQNIMSLSMIISSRYAYEGEYKMVTSTTRLIMGGGETHINDYEVSSRNLNDSLSPPNPKFTIVPRTGKVMMNNALGF